jgi:hypothetical protein
LLRSRCGRRLRAAHRGDAVVEALETGGDARLVQFRLVVIALVGGIGLVGGDEIGVRRILGARSHGGRKRKHCDAGTGEEPVSQSHVGFPYFRVSCMRK